MKIYLVAIFVFSMIFSTAYAAPSEDTIAGGRLYDKWWVDTELSQPVETHPAYPADGQKKGADTWRCKECHGWDYRGKDGAYQTGSHFTGIIGIRGKVGANPDAIVQILTNTTHQYSDKLSTDSLRLLAQFVSQGQMDMSRYIDTASKKVNGNSNKGKTLFADNCQSCHGKQGDATNLSHKNGETVTIGGISNNNPWETMHKIRFGHPGAAIGMPQMHNNMMNMGDHMMRLPMWRAMPPMFDHLSESEQVDLLTYLQTLPR